MCIVSCLVILSSFILCHCVLSSDFNPSCPSITLDGNKTSRPFSFLRLLKHKRSLTLKSYGTSSSNVLLPRGGASIGGSALPSTGRFYHRRPTGFVDHHHHPLPWRGKADDFYHRRSTGSSIIIIIILRRVLAKKGQRSRHACRS